MAVSHEIQYFLGANSPTGFYSLYSELLPPETASVIYILKGGPGCGKSTLMRQVAQQAAQAGETVEYILCSADPDSLDAVVLPRLGAALVDGTAPHVVEPKYPGAVEQYVNLGDCYDRAGLRAIRGEILTCMATRSTTSGPTAVWTPPPRSRPTSAPCWPPPPWRRSWPPGPTGSSPGS